jgi:hypothetical protein
MPTVTRIIVVVTLVAFGAAIGCDGGRAEQAKATWNPSTTQPVSSTQPAARGPEYLNLLEAVFRYQFDHNASGSQRNVDYFFLSLDRSDPPPELLERFKDQTPRVFPRSLAKASAGEGVKHKDLGGRGLIFTSLASPGSTRTLPKSMAAITKRDSLLRAILIESNNVTANGSLRRMKCIGSRKRSAIQRWA